MSKSVNVDFVTRQIEVDTDGKEYYVSAAVAAKDAEQSMLSAQNAANAAEAVAPEYVKTKAVLDNIVDYTNTATEQANIATAQATLATTKATNASNSAANAAQSYANADAIATQLTEYLSTKETLTAPAVDKTLLIDGAAADSKRTGIIDDGLTKLYDLVGGNYIFDVINVADFKQGYLKEAGTEIVNVDYQIATLPFYIGKNKTINISVEDGYRVYVYEYDGETRIPHGWYNAGQLYSLTLQYDYIAILMTKNPYSTSDVIRPSEKINAKITCQKNGGSSDNIIKKVNTLFKIPSRNKWDKGDISFTDYLIIGTKGVDMLPSGTYTIIGDITSSDGYITFNVYGASDGAILTIQLNVNKHFAVQIKAAEPIQRFFFKSSTSTNEVLISNVQVEEAEWNRYEYTDTSKLIPAPYLSDDIEPYKTIVEASKEKHSYWEGKTINFNGDSITQGLNVDGEALTGYVKFVTKELKFGVVNNYAVGGTRLAHVDDVENCMVDRYTDMSTDADIVYIMANTNDYASQVPIGAADSDNPREYNGALNIIFTWLKANFPTQPIIISTQLTRKNNIGSDGKPLPIGIEQYVQAVRDRVADYNFILFDAYAKSGLDLKNSPLDGSGITNDGLHPNIKGALALGRKVAKFIDAQ